jgi:replicative DNA helicase
MLDTSSDDSKVEDLIGGKPLEIGDVLKQAMDRIADRADSGGYFVTGVPTGLIDLDNVTTGFHPGQLMILASRPSMGKTALVLNFCDHIGVDRKIPVLVVSLELGAREIGERLLCARSRVDGYKLRTGLGLGMREIKHLSSAYKELSENVKIFIDDGPARSINEIAAVSRYFKRHHQIGLLVVDSIHLVGSDDADYRRPDTIAETTRGLKTLALELKIPVIALSQVSRAVESRKDKRPRLSDLSESGAVEAIADIVLFLYRPEYYDANDEPGIAELLIAKNRNGSTGVVRLVFLKNLTRFENLSAAAEPFDDGKPF